MIQLLTCQVCGNETDPDDLIDGVCYDCAHDEHEADPDPQEGP